MLNYKTIADLIAAFQSGVKFKADTPNHKGVDVTGISLNPTRRGRFLVTTGGSTHWHQFRLDGSHELGGQYRLYQVEAPAKAPAYGQAAKLEKIGEAKDPKGTERLGTEATFTFKRSDFGMTGMMQGLGDDITVTVALEAIKGDGAPAK